MVMATPGANSVYVKDHESSKRMRVDFSRDPKSFAINRYAQIWPASKQEGYYLEMGLEEAARILSDDAAEHNWADGADRPLDFTSLEDFEFKPFMTKRKSYTTVIGDLTSEQATWDILEQHLRKLSQKAMTARTMLAQTELQNASNYDSSHTSAVASIGANTGNFGTATTQNQIIKRSLNHAAEVILKDTLGAVRRKDLIFVIGPELAHILSETQEFVDHVKGSPEAYGQVKGDLEGLNSEWQMPDKLYGIPLVVEDCVRVSNRKGATASKAFVLGSAKAMLVSRIGGLTGVDGAPSFSSIVQFMKEEMTVEREHEKFDRRCKLAVTDDFQAKLIAPVSSFLFTSAS